MNDTPTLGKIMDGDTTVCGIIDIHHAKSGVYYVWPDDLVTLSPAKKYTLVFDSVSLEVGMIGSHFFGIVGAQSEYFMVLRS